MSSARDTPLRAEGLGRSDAPLVMDSAQQILDTAPCGFITTLPDGTLTSVNATFASWTGHARTALLADMRFQDLLTGPDRETYETQVVPQLNAQGFVREVVFQLEQLSGAPRQVLVSASLSRDDKGRPLAVQTMILDATDRLTRDEELQVARNEVQQLAAIIISSKKRFSLFKNV